MTVWLSFNLNYMTLFLLKSPDISYFLHDWLVTLHNVHVFEITLGSNTISFSLIM